MSYTVLCHILFLVFIAGPDPHACEQLTLRVYQCSVRAEWHPADQNVHLKKSKTHYYHRNKTIVFDKEFVRKENGPNKD